MEDQPLVQRLARPEAQDFAQEAPTPQPVKFVETCFSPISLFAQTARSLGQLAQFFTSTVHADGGITHRRRLK